MRNAVLKIILATSVTMLVTACGEEAQDGNTATVGMTMGSYATARNNLRPWWMEMLAPKAQAAITSGSLKFCFKRLRLKLPDAAGDSDAPGFDAEADEDNVDFDLGEVTVDAAGTDLGDLTAPVGLYRRIEFDLESDCASGNSISLTNDNGSYSSQERITIRFEGDFVVEENGAPIVLPLDNIVTSLNGFNPTTPGDQVSVSQELKDAAEVIGNN